MVCPPPIEIPVYVPAYWREPADMYRQYLLMKAATLSLERSIRKPKLFLHLDSLTLNLEMQTLLCISSIVGHFHCM